MAILLRIWEVVAKAWQIISLLASIFGLVYTILTFPDKVSEIGTEVVHRSPKSAPAVRFLLQTLHQELEVPASQSENGDVLATLTGRLHLRECPGIHRNIIGVLGPTTTLDVHGFARIESMYLWLSVNVETSLLKDSQGWVYAGFMNFTPNRERIFDLPEIVYEDACPESVA